MAPTHLHIPVWKDRVLHYALQLFGNSISIDGRLQFAADLEGATVRPEETSGDHRPRIAAARLVEWHLAGYAVEKMPPFVNRWPRVHTQMDLELPQASKLGNIQEGWLEERHAFESQVISWTQYNPQYMKLRVCLRGEQVREYGGVPPEVANEIQTSRSPGRVYNARIKYKCPVRSV